MKDYEIPAISHLYADQGLAGQTLNWIGTDQLNRWQHHLNDPICRERLIKSGWNEFTTIEYRLNSHGFRCLEFDNSSKIIVLGCSFTFGVGLHEYQTWPYLLSQEIGRPVWNLATGSASLDTCWRVLDNYLPRLNAECIILCEPDPDRFEIWNHANVRIACSSAHDNKMSKDFTDIWYSSPINQNLAKEKNIRSMLYISQQCNTRFINFCRSAASERYWTGDADESRCLVHLGPRSQEKIFKYVLDLYLNS